MRIGEVAKDSGVSVRALRYYEEQGLLTSVRTTGGQRVYSADAVGRVDWIRMLLGAGLSTATIRDFLPCFESHVVTDDVRTRLAVERDRLDAHVQALVATRDRLDSLIVASERPDEQCGEQRGEPRADVA
ncbi:MerR family transcriptional regulator [Actinomycetospora atypica]|uniref:MerR family transcriptional regulator n=1 Tax=Actinomycetospora atypica TaxID=1290095 RepID=A0ABV9YKU1_9PSEU